MELLLDGNSEKDAHWWSDLGCLIYLGQVKNLFVSEKKPIFLYAVATSSELYIHHGVIHAWQSILVLNRIHKYCITLTVPLNHCKLK